MTEKSRLADKRGYLILGLLFSIYLIASFFRRAPSALSNVLMQELYLNYTAAGLVMSIYTLPYALMQVPSGILCDRWGAKRTMLLFLAISVAGNLAFYGARRFEVFLLSRVVVGFGSSTLYVNAVKLIKKRLSQEKLARGLGVFSAASPLGDFIAYFGLPFFYSTINAWRPIYLSFSISMIILLILAALLIQESPTRERTGISKDGSFGILKSMVSNRVLLPLFFGNMFFGFSMCFWAWMPKYLVDVKGFSYVVAGFISSIPTLTSIAGCVLVGAVSDKLRRRKLPLSIFSTLYSLTLTLIILLAGSSPLPVFAASFALLGITSSMWVLPYTMVAEALPPDLTGIGLGLINFMGFLGSSAMTPLFGALVDATGSYTLSNQIIIVVSAVIVFVYACLAKETYPRPNES